MSHRTVPARSYVENVVRSGVAVGIGALAAAAVDGEALLVAVFTVVVYLALFFLQDILPIPNPGTGLPPEKGAPK